MTQLPRTSIPVTSRQRIVAWLNSTQIDDGFLADELKSRCCCWSRGGDKRGVDGMAPWSREGQASGVPGLTGGLTTTRSSRRHSRSRRLL